MGSTLKARSLLVLSATLICILVIIILPPNTSATDTALINHIASSTHPDQNSWYTNTTAFFTWNTSTYDSPDYVEDVKVVGNTAYLADGSLGLKIMDITDPMNPVLIGTNQAPGIAAEVVISGNHAYVADNSYGLYVIDVSDPANPIVVDSFPVNNWLIGMDVSGNYLYIIDSNDGLFIFDISDPANIVLTGTWDFHYRYEDVEVSGNYAYVSCHLDGLKIIDVSDPSNPALAATINAPGSDFFRDLTVSGNHVFLVDHRYYVVAYDVSDPLQPALVSTTVLNTPVDLVVHEGFLYSANYNSGISITDVTNPSQPVVMAHYGTTQANGVAIKGNFVFVADRHGGLLVMDINGIPTDYSFAIDNTLGTMPDTVPDGSEPTTYYQNVADGVWYFHIRAKSLSGVWGPTAHYQVNIESTGPEITILLPPEPVKTDTATFEIIYSDALSGVDMSTASVIFNLENILNDCTIGVDKAVCTVTGLDNGNHAISAGVRDNAGNYGSATDYLEVNFCADYPKPEISLAYDHSYWASYSDYEMGLLSVDYLLANQSQIVVYNLRILATANTNGVNLYGWSFSQPGIPGGGSVLATLNYLVPPGVASFKSRVHMAADNECGYSYAYPGPWPGY